MPIKEQSEAFFAEMRQVRALWHAADRVVNNLIVADQHQDEHGALHGDVEELMEALQKTRNIGRSI